MGFILDMDTISENKNSVFTKSLSAGLGWAGYTAARYSVLAIPYSKFFKKYSAQHKPKDIEDSLQKAIEKYNLNCDIVDINSDNVVSVIKSIKTSKMNFFQKFLYQTIFFVPQASNKKIIGMINKKPEKRSFYEKIVLRLNQPYQIALGNDAAGGNSVKINKSKNGLMGYHELGHIYHFKKDDKFIKFLLKFRPHGQRLMTLPLGLNIIANSSDNFSDNTKQKIRQMSPIAGMVLFLPQFAEEILASTDGNKFAKEVCSKTMLKNVKNTNRVSMLIKIAQLLSISLGIALAGIIPDKILLNKFGLSL